MEHNNQRWWIGTGFVALVLVILLAAIASRQSPAGPAEALSPGDSEGLRARVIEILDEGTVEQGRFSQPYQRLLLRVTHGALQGQEVVADHGVFGLTGQNRVFRTGDRVLVEHTRTIDNEDIFVITDYVRTMPLLWLTLLFVGSLLLLSGWQGVRALAGMILSLFIIVAVIVPQILAGHNPLMVAILGAVGIMGSSLYLVYGWQKKTHVAVIGLFFSLVVTGLLSVLFVNWTRLSGYGAEEVAYLQVAGLQLDLRGLLLAGVIIGTLGALDDVVIGQSSSIFELGRANPDLGSAALFEHGMKIGLDHIAAMVNTLLLAYIGAALPLVLLFSVSSEPMIMTLNRELVAEEIVRTLVGSLGLLAGVPLTSLVAALVASREGQAHLTEE